MLLIGKRIFQRRPSRRRLPHDIPFFDPEMFAQLFYVAHKSWNPIFALFLYSSRFPRSPRVKPDKSEMAGKFFQHCPPVAVDSPSYWAENKRLPASKDGIVNVRRIKRKVQRHRCPYSQYTKENMMWGSSSVDITKQVLLPSCYLTFAVLNIILGLPKFIMLNMPSISVENYLKNIYELEASEKTVTTTLLRQSSKFLRIRY